MKRNILGSFLGLATVLLLVGGIGFGVAKAKGNDGNTVYDDAEIIEIAEADEDSEVDSENLSEETETLSEETYSEEVSETESEEKEEKSEKKEKDEEDTSEKSSEKDKKLTEEEEIKKLLERVENGEGLVGEDAEKLTKYYEKKFGVMQHFKEKEYTPYILYENPKNDYERMWNEVTNAPTEAESKAREEILLNSSFDQNGMLVQTGTPIIDENDNVVDYAE